MKYETIKDQLMQADQFRKTGTMDFQNDIPNKAVLYCVKIKLPYPEDLPLSMIQEMKERKTTVLYIGQAKTGTQNRGLRK